MILEMVRHCNKFVVFLSKVFVKTFLQIDFPIMSFKRIAALTWLLITFYLFGKCGTHLLFLIGGKEFTVLLTFSLCS